MVNEANLHRYNGNQTAPSKSDSAKIAECVIKSVCPSLDLGEDFPVMFGDTWRDCLASLLGLLSKCSLKSRGRDFLEVGIL